MTSYAFGKSMYRLVNYQQFDIGDQCIYGWWSFVMWFVINMSLLV